MKTWKIIVNVILALFGIATITVSCVGVKKYQDGVLDKQLYDFSVGMIVLGAIVCLGVIIWVITDICITIFKNPNNAYDEQAYYSKQKIKKYRNNFSPGKLPTLNKKKLTDTEGYFANDLQYTEEYLKSHKQDEKTLVVDAIALKVEQRKQNQAKKNSHSKKKHK